MVQVREQSERPSLPEMPDGTRPPLPPLFELPRTGLRQWEAIGASPAVLRTLAHGHRLNFWAPPPPYQAKPIEVHSSDRDWLREEIGKNLQRGSWLRATEKPRHCAAAFIASNNGKRRVVIDLRHVNKFLRSKGCRYDTLKSLRHLLRRGDYMLSMDLESGYHHIGIAQEHVKYLGFQIDGEFFYCTALPFGLSTAPRVFTKVMRAFVGHLRGRGIRVLPYLDDFLFCLESAEEAEQAAKYIDNLLLSLGLRRNRTKGSWLPVQRIEHLGFAIDSLTMLFKVTERKETRVRTFARELMALAQRRTRRVPVRMLSSFCGVAVSLWLAVPEARLRTRALFDALKDGGRLTRPALGELHWWAATQWASHGADIMLPLPELLLETDASDLGWGVVLKKLNGNTIAATRGYWSLQDLALPIMNRELIAVEHAVSIFGEELQGKHFRLNIDNVAAAFGLIQLHLRQAVGRHCIANIWMRLQQLRARMLVTWIRSEENVDADALSRVVDRTDYQLNPRFFSTACRRWGTPDVDAFASRLNAQLPVFWSARREVGAAAVDAMAQSLQDRFLWANPPWAMITPWLEKVKRDPSCKVNMVVPYWTSALWFPLLNELADEMLVLEPEVDMFLPGFKANSLPIGKPHWKILLCHIPVRARLP